MTNNESGANRDHGTTINSLAIELGVTSEEVMQALEIVGDDPVRIREFIRRNHTEQDDTNEV